MDAQQKDGGGIIADALPPVDIRDAPRVSTDQADAGVGQPPIAAPVPNMQFASFGSRFLAAVVDSIALGIISAIVSTILTIGSSSILLSNLASGSDPISLIFAGVGIYILLFLVQTGVTFCYLVIWQHKKTQTFGKKTMGIKVIDVVTRETPSIGKLALRETIGKWVSSITVIGLFMPLWDSKKQALHDKIAGTVVVRV